MTYSMSSAILTVAGAATGETLVGHADFQLADNVIQKMHIGNFTMYLKSIVYQPHHVWVADAVMSSGYVGGNNCEFRQPDVPNDPPKDASHASMYSVLVPYEAEGSQSNGVWESELPNPMDITGKYERGNPALQMLNNSVKSEHYACAGFYAKKFAWNNELNTADTDTIGTDNRWNTLVFQGHQARGGGEAAPPFLSFSLKKPAAGAGFGAEPQGGR